MRRAIAAGMLVGRRYAAAIRRNRQPKVRPSPVRVGRRVALVSVVTVVGAAGCGSMASVRVSGVGPAVPKGALRLVQRVFVVDAQSQLAGTRAAGMRRAEASVERSMSVGAARRFKSLVARDAAAAAVTRARGLTWDTSTTSIPKSGVLRQAPRSLRIHVDVEDSFHIVGGPTSVAIDPYEVDLSRATDGSWQIDQLTPQQAGP